MTTLIGTRLKALREQQKLSQDDLARVFGFKDRQTVSAIETGERRLSAEELLTAVEKLGAPLDYFTDPFLLIGEGGSPGGRPVSACARLDALRAQCRALDRGLSHARAPGRPAHPLLRRTLGLTQRRRFEEAMRRRRALRRRIRAG